LEVNFIDSDPEFYINIKKFKEFDKSHTNVKKKASKTEKNSLPGWESNPRRLHAIPPQRLNAVVVSRAGDAGLIPRQGNKFFSVSEAFFTFFIAFFELVEFFYAYQPFF